MDSFIGLFFVRFKFLQLTFKIIVDHNNELDGHTEPNDLFCVKWRILIFIFFALWCNTIVCQVIVNNNFTRLCYVFNFIAHQNYNNKLITGCTRGNTLLDNNSSVISHYVCNEYYEPIFGRRKKKKILVKLIIYTPSFSFLFPPRSL